MVVIVLVLRLIIVLATKNKQGKNKLVLLATTSRSSCLLDLFFLPAVLVVLPDSEC